MSKRKLEASLKSDSDSNSSNDEASDSYYCKEKQTKIRKIENVEIKKMLVEYLNVKVLFQISLYGTSYDKKFVGSKYYYEKKKSKYDLLELFKKKSKKEMFKLVFPDDVGDDFPGYFMKSLKNGKVKAEVLTKIVGKCFKEEELSIKPPRLKTEMMEWIVCKLFNLETSITKRNIEKDQINQINKIFLRINSKELPEEILLHILSFCKKNLSFLNNFGIVNSNCYVLSLKSFDYVRISKRNIYVIPVLVLMNVKKVIFECSSKVYQKEYEYILEKIQNVRELKLYSHVTKFLWAAKKNHIILRNCLFLGIGYCNKPEYDIYEVFPKLQYFSFTRSIPKEVKSIYSVKHVSVEYYKYRSCVDNIPYYFCKPEMNLKSLFLSSYASKKSLEVISKMKNLETLRVAVRKKFQSDFNNLLCIYSKLKCLKSLTIEIYSENRWEITQNIFPIVSNFENIARMKKLEKLKFEFRPFKEESTDYVFREAERERIALWEEERGP